MELIKREDAIKAIEDERINGTSLCKADNAVCRIKGIPSAENKGEWKAKSIETYELPEGQIVVEYDASGVGLISRECMEMLVDTLATNKPKQGEWIYWGKCVFPYECTQCHDKAREDYDFCPNCGTRMVKQ